jgi:hypothetical protein
LPFTGTISVNGETCHGRAGYGFGVRFVELTVDDQKRLDRALDKLRRRRTTH